MTGRSPGYLGFCPFSGSPGWRNWGNEGFELYDASVRAGR
jgi:hypothetical protein